MARGGTGVLVVGTETMLTISTHLINNSLTLCIGRIRNADPLRLHIVPFQMLCIVPVFTALP